MEGTGVGNTASIDQRSLLPLSASSPLLRLGGGNSGSSGGEAASGVNTVEIPLAFHGSSDSNGVTRLIVNDVSRTVVPVDPLSSEALVAASANKVDVRYLRSLASSAVHPMVSSGRDGSSKVNKVMVTTAADPERPQILVINALPVPLGGGATNAPRASQIELDISQLDEFYQPIVVKTFLHPAMPEDAYQHHPVVRKGGGDVMDDMRQSMDRYDESARGRYSSASSLRDGPVLRVIMVDTAGTLLTVFLSFNTGNGFHLCPLPKSASNGHNTASVIVNSIPSLLTQSLPHLYVTPGSTLSASDVDFLSPTRLVIALAPHLLCVDTWKKKVVTWSMNIGRRTTFGGVLHQAGQLLVGNEIDDDDYYLEDENRAAGGRLAGKRAGARGEDESMAPVSALTVVTHIDEEKEGDDYDDDDGMDEDDRLGTETGFHTKNSIQVVFTLHSDGTLRMWYLGAKPSLLPKKVRLLRVPGEIGSAAFSASATASDDSYRGGALGFFSARKAPRSVRVGEDPPLPEPSNWSSDVDAIVLRGKLAFGSTGIDGDGDELRYSLAVSIRTIEDPLADYEFAEQQQHEAQMVRSPSLTSPGGGRSINSLNQGHGHRRGTSTLDSSTGVPPSQQQRRISPCHILVVSGVADGKPGLAGTDGAVPLLIPSGVRSVVDMDFCPGDNSSSGSASELHALFATSDDESKLRRYQSGVPVSSTSLPLSRPAGTLFVAYEASQSTAVSPLPKEMGASSTVDFTALAEKDGIYDLMASLSKDIESGVFDSLEDITEMIDRACMTHLFRPATARSVGGTHVGAAFIRRAINHLVPTYDKVSTKIEVDALLAMREWTRSDDAIKAVLGNKGDDAIEDIGGGTEENALGGDVYRTFAKASQTTKSNRADSSMIDVIDEDEDENVDVARKRKAKTHLSRWIKFLFTVHDEEECSRSALCLTSLSGLSKARTSKISAEVALIVRGGLTTSTTATVDSASSGTIAEKLDSIAMSMLRCLRVSTNESLSDKLSTCVHKISTIVAKSGLIMNKLDSDLVAELANLGSTALTELGGRNTTAMEDSASTMIATITSLLDALTAEEITQWLSPISAASSATVHIFAGGVSATNATSTADPAGFEIPPLEYRSNVASASCSAYLARLQLDSVRHLCLARCLLILGAERLVTATSESARAANVLMGRTAGSIVGGRTDISNDISGVVANEEICQGALRAYLHASAVQWAVAQKLELSQSLRSSTVEVAPSGSSRLRLGGGNHPVKNITEDITVLEGMCVVLGGSMNSECGVIGAPSSAVCVTARMLLDLAYGSAPGVKPVYQLSLLGPFDQPRIALRLLAPFVAYPESNLSYESIQKTAEAAATFLLTEASFAEQNGTMGEERILAVRERASAILRNACHIVASDEVEDLTLICEILKKLHDSAEDIGIKANTALEELMQEVLVREPSPQKTISEDIKRLSKMQSLRGLLLPLLDQAEAAQTGVWNLVELQYPDELKSRAGDDAKSLFYALLSISDLIHRASILERHCSSAVGPSAIASGAGVVLKAIHDVIAVTDTLLPRAMAEEYMPEYPMAHSSAFRFAILGRDWDAAYEAALANPLKDRRISCFKRLVIAMADAGYTHELIAMPLTVVGKPQGPAADDMDISGDEPKFSASDELDLYEIAAATLADAAIDQNRSASSIEGATNYLGCLYSLHSSRGNHRRAASAMRFGGSLARGKAATSPEEFNNERNANAIIESISLTALSAAHSIQLEENVSHRFIVEGEIEQYSIPPMLREGMGQTGAFSSGKRTRDGGTRRLLDFPGAQDASVSANDRSSKLLLEKDLIADAIRTVGLRTMLRDQEDSDDKTNLFSNLQANSTAIIDCLASKGYYDLALGVAKTLQDKKGVKPGGRDIFSDSLSYIIGTYIIPNAIKGQHPPEEGSDRTLRPSLAQIHVCSDRTNGAFGIASSSSESWKTSDWQVNSVKANASMNLLRVYVSKYADATNQIAVEVAANLLDVDGAPAKLPVWLTDLLCGTSSASCFGNVVASRDNDCNSSNAANPTELVKLLMKRGLYVDACKCVVQVLDTSRSRIDSSAARLPEAGSIDYVPYSIIDQLWNIIEAVANEGGKDDLISARNDMEQALEGHMKALQIAEKGIKSARALA